VISENGRWINGKADALDWTDVRTAPGLAFGLQSGSNQGRAQYDDSMAFLTGEWGPSQSASATVRSLQQDDVVYEEVELLLRGAMAPHCVSAYEINFRCSKAATAYAEIVRWNGALGEFTYLTRGVGSEYGVGDGDQVKATIAGDVITAYINGREILRVADRAYGAGNPGMGFYLRGVKRAPERCGFRNYSASAE
jgi:hypothetical protein